MIQAFLTILTLVLFFQAPAFAKFEECLAAEDRLNPLLADLKLDTSLEGKAAVATAFLAQQSFYFPDECEEPRKARKKLCKNIKLMYREVSGLLSRGGNAANGDSAVEVLRRLEIVASERACKL